MSNADPAEVSMVVSRDGVTVEKSFEPDDFPVPAIAFVVRSEREEDVTVRLSDEVPEQVDPEDIGFHPKYGAEFWSVEDGSIVFDREFEAGEEYTTVYGLRASQTDDVESYMTEPTLDEVDPPLDDAGDVVRDVIGGDGESDAEAGGPSSSDIEAAIAAADAADDDGAAAADDGTDDEEVEPLTLNDPNEAGDVEPDVDDVDVDASAPAADAELVDEVTAESTDGDAVPAATASTDDLAAALASQIRAGEASDDDLAALRNALGGGGDGSTDARIKQLQSELADLRAYTGALEEFLDENGDARQVVEDLTGSVERIDSQLSEVEDRAESAVSRADAVESDVGSVDDTVDELSTELSSVREQVDDVESEMAAFTDAVDDVESDVEGLADDVGGLADDVEEMDETVEEMDETVEAVDETVEDLDDRVADVESSLDQAEGLDERLADLEAEFDEAREDLESLSRMREQLSSVFGAQVDGPGADEDGEDDADDES